LKCNAFNENQEIFHIVVQVLEYHGDLKYYWINGYGNALNGDMSCQFVKDLSETFGDGKQKGTFYFSHSDSLLPFQSLLGLYDDGFDLTEDIFGEAKTDNRKYRTSSIGTFAQNIGFVLFECENDEKKIVTLHQEKQVAIDVCGGKMECNWEEFKVAFAVRIQYSMNFF